MNPETVIKSGTMRLTVARTLAGERGQSMGARSRSLASRLVVGAIVLLVAVAMAPRQGQAAIGEVLQTATRKHSFFGLEHVGSPDEGGR